MKTEQRPLTQEDLDILKGGKYSPAVATDADGRITQVYPEGVIPLLVAEVERLRASLTKQRPPTDEDLLRMRGRREKALHAHFETIDMLPNTAKVRARTRAIHCALSDTSQLLAEVERLRKALGE